MVKTNNAPVRAKKKTNLLKLSNEMNKHIFDANDREIIKRFKTTITSASEEDISKSSLDLIIKTPHEVNIASFPEGIQPYIKHYLFMIKRRKT